MKRIQNHVAESRMALPLTAVYAILVWLGCGLLTQQWWIQLACFAVSTFLVMVLNNNNVLLRIYSRMVSCSFLVLSCTACFLFSDIKGGFVQFCVIAAYIILFHCYQDKQTPGWFFYAYLFLGLASTVFIQMLFFLPIIWILTATQLNALSWRTFFASLLGLLTPYWLGVTALFFRQKNFDFFITHLATLKQFQTLGDYSMVTLPRLLVFLFVIALALTGTIHFWRTSYNDKIRTRQLYGFFMTMTVFTTLFLLLQPQHYDVLTRIMILNTSPLIAHFIALTHTKWTNIAFYIIISASLLLTGFNAWTSSLIF